MISERVLRSAIIAFSYTRAQGQTYFTFISMLKIKRQLVPLTELCLPADLPTG